MKKLPKLVILLCASILFVRCSNDKFTIAKGKVGLVTQKTTVSELETLFANDSIVKVLSEGAKGYNYQDDDVYDIYEKGGKQLLRIIPEEQLDSTSVIKSVEIFDERFSTENGLNINSTFNEINANNKISKIEPSLTSVTVFIDDLNATIVLDKEELGLSDFNRKKISIEQIPDLTRMKSFIIWLN